MASHHPTGEEMEPFDRLLFLVPLSQFKSPGGLREPSAAATL